MYCHDATKRPEKAIKSVFDLEIGDIIYWAIGRCKYYSKYIVASDPILHADHREYLTYETQGNLYVVDLVYFDDTRKIGPIMHFASDMSLEDAYGNGNYIFREQEDAEEYLGIKKKINLEEKFVEISLNAQLGLMDTAYLTGLHDANELAKQYATKQYALSSNCLDLADKINDLAKEYAKPENQKKRRLKQAMLIN